MALPAPTVATDPAPSAETNAAFVTLNGYVTTAYTELVTALEAIREHIRLANGSSQLLELFDAQLRTLSSSSLPNPSVVADPATQAQTNAALATMSSYVDRLHTRSLAGINLLREHVRVAMAREPQLVAFDAAVAGIPTAALTAETVASDPVSLTDMNTALANTTVFVDNANSDFVTTLQAFRDYFKLNPGYNRLVADLDTAIAALEAA